MTDDQLQTVREDIAYIRAMAQEGRQAPLLGGSVLIAAGLIFGLSSLVHYGIDSGMLDLPPVSYAILWGGALLTFFVALAILNTRINHKPGALTPTNRAVGAAWMGCGLVIFVSSISMAIIGWKYQTEVPALLFPSLIFALYGAAWAVSATMTGTRWQWGLAIGGWVAAPLLALLAGQSELWLAYWAGLFLLALLPGIVIVRQEPAPVV